MSANGNHPATMLLVEQEQRDLWRVVERKCTPSGLSHEFQTVKRDLTYPEAREVFDARKKPRKSVAAPRYNV